MSSLQQQLSKLSSETIVFTSTGARKNVPSLLYGDSARSISIDTIHEIALAALTELQNIDPAFRAFRDNIFHADAARYDREAHTEEHNLQFIDQPMALFLDQAVPYLHLPAAHRAIEFLIRRFRADIKCVEQLVMVFLPYHETVIFSYLLTCLFNMNDQSKLPSSHILLLLGKEGWPGPRSVLLKQFRRNSYSLFAKLVSKVIDLEKVSVASCLFYLRFCFVMAQDLLAFPALGQEQVLLREVFRLMAWALRPRAHIECREAASFMFLVAPSVLLHGLAESKQGRGIIRLFLQHPLKNDRKLTLKILMGLTHKTFEHNILNILTLTDILYGLCSDEWLKELQGGVLNSFLLAATERQTSNKYRSILISFIYIFADALFRFTTVPWEVASVPEQDRPSLRTAFEIGIQVVTAALQALVEGNEQKDGTFQQGISRLIRHISSLLVKYMLKNESALSSNARLQELAHLAVDISITDFASGVMQPIEKASTEPSSNNESVTSHILSLLFEDYTTKHWMLAPVAAPSGIPCILALDSSSTELKLMGYDHVQTMIERFAAKKPIDVDNLLRTLLPLCRRLLAEGDSKVLAVLCECLDQLITSLPKKIPASLSPADAGTLLSTLIFFYKRLISSGMLSDPYLQTLMRLHDCLIRIPDVDLGQESDTLGAHLSLLRRPELGTPDLSVEELILPFGNVLGMLEAVLLTIESRASSRYTDIILASILKIDAAISSDSREQATLVLLIKQVMGSPGYSKQLIDVVCANITQCSIFLLNTTIRHSTNSDNLTRIGMAYLADKDISFWSIPLFNGSFDKDLATCILHNIFREGEWITRAIDHARSSPSEHSTRPPSAKISKRTSKRESAILQQTSVDENGICDPDFLIACALYLLCEREEHNADFLCEVSQSLQRLDKAIEKDLYGTILKTLQNALTTNESFDIIGTITELLALIAGSTRVCHAFLAQFISKSLVAYTNSWAESHNSESAESLAEMLNDVVMFVNNATTESSPTIMVLFGQALERCVLSLLKGLPLTDRIGVMLAATENGTSESLASTFCEHSALDFDLLQKSLSSPSTVNPIKSSLFTLAESSYVGIVSIADSLGDKDLSPTELTLQQARIYATLAVLGTIPEFVSATHDISALAFILLNVHEAHTLTKEQAKLYEALATENLKYCLSVSFSVSDEIRRFALEYVSRAPLSVAYIGDYFSLFPVTFLESLTRRRSLVDDPNALLSALIAQITDVSSSINSENRREVLALRLVLRMMSFNSVTRSEVDYNERDVYKSLSDATARVSKDSLDKEQSLLFFLETFDQLSYIVPSQADAESLAGLCLFHPELLACAQTVAPERFETLFVNRILEKLITEKQALKLSTEKISQIIINLFQLATRIYANTPAFWDISITLIKSAVEFTFMELISPIDQQRIFLAIIALAEKAYHGVYCLIFLLSNLKFTISSDKMITIAKLKELQSQLINHFVIKLEMEYQLQIIYLLCHGTVWDFLKTGKHKQSLLDVIETLSNTVSCVAPSQKMSESAVMMHSLGFSLLFADIGTALDLTTENESGNKQPETSPDDDAAGKNDSERYLQTDDDVVCEDEFLSTLLIHIIQTLWNVKQSAKETKKAKKKDPNFVNQPLNEALTSVKTTIDLMTSYLDTYSFYLLHKTENSTIHYATSCIIGASILVFNDKDRGQKLLERLIANLCVTSLAMACVKLYRYFLDDSNFQQPCTVLFRLFQQKVSGAIEGRRIDQDDANSAILVLHETFISVVADTSDKEFKRLVLETLVEFCIAFPTTLDSATAVTIIKTITESQIYVSLPKVADESSDVLHSYLRVLSHLVGACDSSILPVLKSLIMPIIDYLQVHTDTKNISVYMEEHHHALFSETTLEVLALLSNILTTQGRFITPYLSDVISQLSLLCPVGPCVNVAFTLNAEDGASLDTESRLDTISRVFTALLPELPTTAQRGMSEQTLQILTVACNGLHTIATFSALRILIPAMRLFLATYLKLVRTHGLRYVEPIIHTVSLVLYPVLSKSAVTNEQRTEVINLVLSIFEIRSDEVCYPRLMPQYDRLETCAIYLIATLDLVGQDKPLSIMLERCWSWCTESVVDSAKDEKSHAAPTIKQTMSTFGSLFEKTYTEAITSIQLGTTPSVPRMVSYAHLLAIFGGLDPQRLASEIKTMLYETIGMYLFAVTSPEGCVSYSLDNHTIAKLIKHSPKYVELQSTPLGMSTTCGLTSPVAIEAIKEDYFFEIYSVGRYFNQFLFACGKVAGVIRDDVYIAALSFMVAVVCSPVSQCDDVQDIVYSSVDAALRAVSGCMNAPVLWEYLHEMCITLLKSPDDALRLRGIELLEVFLTVTITHDTHWLTRAAGMIDEAIEDLNERVSSAAQRLIRSVESVTGKAYKNLLSDFV